MFASASILSIAAMVDKSPQGYDVNHVLFEN